MGGVCHPLVSLPERKRASLLGVYCGLPRGREARNGSPHWLLAAQNDNSHLVVLEWRVRWWLLLRAGPNHPWGCKGGQRSRWSRWPQSLRPGDVGLLVVIDDALKVLVHSSIAARCSCSGATPLGAQRSGELAKSTYRSPCCRPPCSPDYSRTTERR